MAAGKAAFFFWVLKLEKIGLQVRKGRDGWEHLFLL